MRYPKKGTFEERKRYLVAIYKQVWTTVEAEEEFEFLGFGNGLVAVRRESDGVTGSLNFTPEMPRLYFDFLAHVA